MKRLTKHHEYMGKKHISVSKDESGIICSNFCTSCGKADCEYIRKALFKLAEYEDLEKQGKLLRFPCEVGDRIYIILRNLTITKREVIGYARIDRGWAVETEDWFYFFDEFNKTVFLTKEQAEEVLQKKKEKSHE